MVNDSFGHPLPSALAVLLDHAFERNGVGLRYVCFFNKMGGSILLIICGLN